MTSDVSGSVSAWEALDLDELLLLIGQEASSGGAPMEPAKLKQFALSIVRGWYKSVRDHLCFGTAQEREDLLEFMNDVALVVDMGTAFYGGVPVSQLAVASFKYGVRTLCAETA